MGMRQLRLQFSQPFSLFFGTFAFLDVRQGAVPFNDLALLVAQRHSPHEKPAVLAARAAVARLVLEWLATGESRTPFVDVFLRIDGVDGGLPVGTVRSRKSDVIQPTLVYEVWRPIRVDRERHRRYSLDHVPEPLFFAPKPPGVELKTAPEQGQEEDRGGQAEPVRLVKGGRD